jgi:hypothetical protein
VIIRAATAIHQNPKCEYPAHHSFYSLTNQSAVLK